MEWQLHAMANPGQLACFAGMVMNSRSFMSYPCHEHFRRLPCNLIERDVDDGEISDDESLPGSMIRNMCYLNAERYLDLNTPGAAPSTRTETGHVAPA